MRFHCHTSVAVLLGALAFAEIGFAVCENVARHPRIFVTPSVVSQIRAKVTAGDPDWLEVKSRADALLLRSVAPYCRGCAPANSIAYTYEGLGWKDAIEPL